MEKAWTSGDMADGRDVLENTVASAWHGWVGAMQGRRRTGGPAPRNEDYHLWRGRVLA